MEIILIEVLLWAGLIFFFWALRDGLNNVESELDAQIPGTGVSLSPTSNLNYDCAEKVSEPIGRYRDAPIYRYAVIGGKNYQFAYVLPFEQFIDPQMECRCLAPGLVYSQQENLA
ncbi:MAG TPA: hypothetical protein VNW52_11435 [Burkholderiaceae bacterium]|jgi:hypothetical protein|nr:hypothetical protein [Burkholderiaceae bacterium]